MKNSVAGYFTVEAVLIFPVILFVYSFLLYMGFFQYNRCLLEQDVLLAAIKSSRILPYDSAEAARQAVAAVERPGLDKYIGWTAETPRVSAGQGKISIEAGGYMDIPLFRNVPFLHGDRWELREQTEIKAQEPVFFIRLCRRILRGETDAEDGENQEFEQDIY